VSNLNFQQHTRSAYAEILKDRLKQYPPLSSEDSRATGDKAALVPKHNGKNGKLGNPRNAGKLALLMEMPVDIFYEVCLSSCLVNNMNSGECLR
jgi:hypothetical protein